MLRPLFLAAFLLLGCSVNRAAKIHGWAVGNTVLHTIDGGNTWGEQQLPLKSELVAVACVDTDHAWAGGTNGVLVATVDGGNHWTAQTSGVTGNITRFAFLDAATGWATDTDGDILHTRDGGTTWNKQLSGVRVSLGDISFPSRSDGWAAGIGGVIIHTSDGGATWVAQKSGVEGDLIVIHFVDARNGSAMSQDGLVLHTDDGGARWTVQADLQKNIGEAFFLNDKIAWAVGRNLLAQRKDGTHWAILDEGEQFNESISFVDAQNGWLLRPSGEILITGDGGQNWKQRKITQSYQTHISAIVFTNSATK